MVQEDVIEADIDNYVAIHRLGTTNTEDSFDIDLDSDPDFSTRDFFLYPGFITKNYTKSSDWICFKNPPIFFDEVSYAEYHHLDVNQFDEKSKETDHIMEPFVISNLNLRELNKKLNEAVSCEDYDMAAKIRDEITRKKNKLHQRESVKKYRVP